MGLNAPIEQTFTEPSFSYIPRGQNVQKVFKEHFNDFREIYEQKYSKTYGQYSTDRITEVVEEFIKCGDYKEGLARIYGNDDKTREALSQYIAKPPVSLEKITYEPIQKKSALQDTQIQ